MEKIFQLQAKMHRKLFQRLKGNLIISEKRAVSKLITTCVNKTNDNMKKFL